MSTTHGIYRIAILLTLGASALGLWCLAAWAQVKPPNEDGPALAQAAPAAAAQTNYLGVRRCKLCHDRDPKRLATDKSADELRLTEYVQLTEFSTWYQHDKHAQAYKVLEGPLGKRMGEILKTNVTQDKSCLSCHATLHDGKLPPESRRFELVLGVACESCHGPSRQWFVPHMEPAWRVTPTAEKQKLGMLDVRQPLVKAKVCLSCHLGDAQQDRVVTHEMYAAGHPPLGAFETQAFLDQMPPHWLPLAQKNERVRKQLKYDPADLPAAKTVALGGALAMRESLKLLAASANDPHRPHPELARFDCYACHHDLRPDGWRAKRNPRGIPGRPTLTEWPHSLVDLALRQASSTKDDYEKRRADWKAATAPLHAALGAQPFGDPKLIGSPADKESSAGRAIAFLDALIGELDKRPYDQSAALASLRQLCIPPAPNDFGVDFAVDFDSARHRAWAIRSLYAGLSPKPANDSEIGVVLDELTTGLRLALPPRTASDAKTKGGEVEAALGDTLKTLASYDPAWFQSLLKKLSELLPKSP
ncbi:MAG: hypothetical protein IID44_10705 [Planctomycetes bacterium]|nr:hypothetical protein [Planctomycetota bacterium]